MTAPAKKLSDLGKRWSGAPRWTGAVPRIVTGATLVPDSPRTNEIEQPVDLGAEFRRQYEIWRRDHPAHESDLVEPLPPIEETRFDIMRAARLMLIVGGAAVASFYVVGIWPNLNSGGFQPAPPSEPGPVKVASAVKAARLEVPPMPVVTKSAETPPWPTDAAAAPAEASVAPAEPAPKPVPTMAAEEIERIRTRGEEFLATGDLAAARLLLERAAKARDAGAAFSLASTYDPAVLEQLHVYGAKGDIELAIMWYERAKQYGSKDAGRRLIAIAGKM
jgi:hypothetical protein